MSSLSLEESSKNQAVEDYYQFCRVTGSMATGFSHGISCRDYENAYFFKAFDLSSCSEAYNDFFTPANRSGFYRFTCHFSSGLPKPLMAIYILQFSSIMTVSKDSAVSRSFTV